MLISNDFNRLFVLKLKTGSVLVFWTRVHCFFMKIRYEFAVNKVRRYIWYLFLHKNLFIIAQYVFDAVSGQSNFELILAIKFCFPSIISFVHSFDWFIDASVLYSEGFLQYLVTSIDLFFSAEMIKVFIHSGVLQSNF